MINIKHNTSDTRYEMKNDEYLNVWYGDELVGILWQNSAGSIGFRYQENWIKKGFAISQQLLLDKQEYAPETGIAHQYFANLLPEADARKHVIRQLKISDTDYELLKAIGNECAGALSILQSTQSLNTAHEYKKIPEAIFERLLKDKGQIFPVTANQTYPRLSMAGAQDKYPILFDGKDYFIPQGSAPSTHIIKFELMHYRNIPAYEYFLTQLAKAINLPVVDIELRNKKGHYYLLIKRYDRIYNDINDISRLHQEDFCQALGVGYDKKYQQEGGPTFQDCFALTKRVSITPTLDIENLLIWQIFNFLAGNSDGHAKNLSFIYNENHKPSLAPFYDLVCTRAIKGINPKLALSIGGEFDPGKITVEHWEKFADECDLRQKYLLSLLKNTALSLSDNLDKVLDEFQKKIGPYPALQRVEKVIKKQCKKVLS